MAPKDKGLNTPYLGFQLGPSLTVAVLEALMRLLLTTLLTAAEVLAEDRIWASKFRVLVWLVS